MCNSSFFLREPAYQKYSCILHYPDRKEIVKEGEIIIAK
jgi:hypothetical protein